MNGSKTPILGMIALAAGAVTIVVAATTSTEAIKQRQEQMEGVRDQMMVLGAIAKKEQPFDAEVVHTAGAKVADHLAQAADLFPEGSDAGEVQTWAKPEIWSDRANFDTIMADARQAAVDLEDVTEAEAFMPALGKLGNGCKSCHDLYRLPKEH